ncbi:hypothetical protein [Streptomyces sp. NRRL F-2747]|nr:hypothetical protein [Streptomyces sp. NRRL F-2747]
MSGITFADSSLLHALLDAHERVVLTGSLPNQFRRVLPRAGAGRRGQ